MRLSVLDPGGTDVVDRVEKSWPPARFKSKKFFIGNDNTLATKASAEASNVSYPATDGSISFPRRFEEDAEIVGYMKLRLWVEADGSDDMELSVTVEKRDAEGNSVAIQQGEGMSGPLQATGMLRVSQRELNPKRSTANEPFLTHRREQRLKPGEIVPVEIGIWPIGMRLHKDEQLVLTVAAHRYAPASSDLGFGTAIVPVPKDGGTFEPGSTPELVQLGGPMDSSPDYAYSQRVQTPVSRNKGTHRIHFGGAYDSHLLVPLALVSG